MNGLDQPIVLAGDIGGTKTNLGLFARGENRPTMLVMESYSSAHAAGLSELITRFLEAHPQSVSAACFGIAGPVIDGRCKATNLPWEVSEAEIGQNFNWNKVRLINDLAATALAVPLLHGPELSTLNAMPAERWEHRTCGARNRSGDLPPGGRRWEIVSNSFRGGPCRFCPQK